MALRKVGALWRAREGSKAVMTGTLEVVGHERRIVVVQNDRRKGDREPEWNLLVATDEKKGEGDADDAPPF